MDRIPDYGSGDEGSNPSRGTNNLLFYMVFVAEWPIAPDCGSGIIAGSNPVKHPCEYLLSGGPLDVPSALLRRISYDTGI